MEEVGSMEFLKQVLGVLDSLGVDEYRGESKKVEMLVNKMVTRESEVDTIHEEKKELERKLQRKEVECEELKRQLEVAKWARLDAEVGMREMGARMVQVYKRIEEVVQTIPSADEEVEVLEETHRPPETYLSIWTLLEKLKKKVDEKVKELDKSRQELKSEIVKVKDWMADIEKVLENYKLQLLKDQADTTNRFYVPVVQVDEPNLDIVVEEVEIGEERPRSKPATPAPTLDLRSISSFVEPRPRPASTVPLSHHAASRPGPPSTVPLSHHAEPISDDEDSSTPATMTLTYYQPTPPPTPQYTQPEVVNNLVTTQLHHSSMVPPPPQDPLVPHSVIQFASPAPPPALYSPKKHAVDTFRRQVGYFCTCGLECSTKKALQYHLRSKSQNVITPRPPPVTLNQDFSRGQGPPKFSAGPSHRPYNLIQNLLENSSGPYQVPPTTLTVPIFQAPEIRPYYDPPPHVAPIRCEQCPDEFTNLVQYRLHLKLKHNNVLEPLPIPRGWPRYIKEKYLGNPSI